MNSIEWLLEIPKRNATREFLIDTISKQTITFGDLYQEALNITGDLRHRCLQKGDRVAILLHNSADFVKLYFGCLYAGIVTVPINPVLSNQEINFILQNSNAKLLIVSPGTIDKVDCNISKEINLSILVILDKSQNKEIPKNIEIWDLSSLKSIKEIVPFENVCPDDIMSIVYTSGTTSRPKGVVHSISNMIDNARIFNKRLNIGPEHRFYGILAMTYLGGYYNLLILPYVGESSVVLTHTFDARSVVNFWEPAIENSVNTLWFVPTVISILLEMDRDNVGESYCRKNVKLALVGIAPLPIKLKQDFQKRYGIKLYENYGLSETFFISSETPLFENSNNSVGRILPNIEVKILNDEYKEVEKGTEGEISIKSPYLMNGYYSYNYQKPVLELHNGWFLTGDIGVLSYEGDLFITDRKKDLIIRGGINISPAAIESVIYKNPAVSEAAVVGIPHVFYGENIAVVISLNKVFDFNVVKKELLKSCSDQLGLIKQPSHIFEMENLPYSSSGKIQKKKIREILIQKLGLNELAIKSKSAISSCKPKLNMIPGRVRKTFKRPDQKLISEFKKYPSSIVSDCMNRMGIMDSCIRSLVKGRSFCGPAFTVEEVEGGNIMSHLALELIQPGDVLVIDGKGVTTRSCWGGLQTLMAKERGVIAIVIYGTIRDYEDIIKDDMPVFALGSSPGGPLKGWGGNINYPISCGGSVVNPGDIVIGDDDGVVVVPLDLVEEIIPICSKRLKKENRWFKDVKAGKSTITTVGLEDKIKKLGLIIKA